MTVIEAILLGILQGLTEFLPVSSDGHLSVLQLLLGVETSWEDFLGFGIVLHAGSLIALVLCYGSMWVRLLTSPFRDDRDGRHLLLMLIIATIPGVLAGLLLEDLFTSFRSPLALGMFFLVTGVVLLIGEKYGKEKLTTMRIGWWQSLLIGMAQALALLPSISRSGMTVSTGRLLGLSRKDSLDFSFLMATPILAGAVVLTSLNWLNGEIQLPSLTVTLSGFVASLAVSLVTVTFLRRLVARFPLSIFAWYVLPLGLVCVAYGLLV